MANEKLSARQVGRNIITIIDGEKYSRKTESDSEVKSIKTKIEKYNKTPSKDLKEKIIQWFSANKKGKVEKEKKEMVKKGLKSSIKKEAKKATKKKGSKISDEPERGEELVEKVKAAHAAGTMTDDQIRDLQKLLAEQEQKRAEQREQEKREEDQQRNSDIGRRRGEH